MKAAEAIDPILLCLQLFLEDISKVEQLEGKIVWSGKPWHGSFEKMLHIQSAMSLIAKLYCIVACDHGEQSNHNQY